MADRRPPTPGERIRRLRLRAGLSQSELAGEELSASYISLIEAGKREPSPQVLGLLAHRLGCPVHALGGGPPSAGRQRAALDLAHARVARLGGAPAEARDRLSALLRGGGLDPDGRDEAEYELAVAHRLLADLDAATDLLLPLLERALTGLSARPVTEVGLALCDCLIEAGDAPAAFRLGGRALAAAEERGLAGTDEHLRLAATVLYAQFRTGELHAAAARARELVELATRTGGPAGQAAVLSNAALIAEARGEPAEALRLSRRALALLDQPGGGRELPMLQVTVAGFLLSEDPDQAGEALELLAAALPALRELGNPADLGRWAIEATRAELALGHPVSAETTGREAVRRLGDLGGPEAVRAALALGDCRAGQGHSDRAVAEFRRAALLLEGLGPGRHLAGLWRDLADRHRRCGALEPAGQAYARALDLAGVRAGNPVAEPLRARALIG